MKAPRRKWAWIAPLIGILFLSIPSNSLAEEDSSVLDSGLIDAENIEGESEEDSGFEHGFDFGTYGRVNVAGDVRGGRGDPVNVVTHGSRLEETTYLELYFYYRLKFESGMKMKMGITLAFFEEFFHFSGQLDSTVIAVREAYVEALNVGGLDGVHLWAGSRMYRGDDIHLLDWWPLDNLNTIGGGLGYEFDNIRIDFHGGVNRLRNNFQFQEVEVVGRGYDTATVTTLDRQRTILSCKLTHQFMDLGGGLGLKYKLYGEFHHLPPGVLRQEDQSDQNLPEDLGGVIGAQLGLWGWGRNSFVNLFLRYGRDLGAYNEMAVPWGLDRERTTAGAQDFILGFSLNWESKWIGLMGGGYYRYFQDADPNQYDLDDYQEFILVARPHIFVTDWFHQAFEISYQQRLSSGFSPTSGDQESPALFKFTVMPVVSAGRSTYGRPQFRLIYTLSYLNFGARDLYPLGDERRDNTLQHFIGFGVEWWINAIY